jgi:adenylate cyclase
MNDTERTDEALPETSVRTGKTTREILLKGVFWRILIIETILLVWSVGYRMAVEMPDMPTLLWYVFRIVVLVVIILAFMMITLSTFLNRRIIQPLEAISRANRNIDSGNLEANAVALPDDVPSEIGDIAKTRMQMLSDVLKESRDRLRLVHVIRETFGRYLSKKVVDEILASPEGQKIGGRREVVTVLMSDLRGFTGMAAKQDPEQTVRVLNRYLSRMSKIIVSYDGVIDEFIGDAILAIFGVPERRPDDAARAIACAIGMQQALAVLNQELAGEKLPTLEMGIGINTGHVIVGNIGSELRMKYGIIGATVNTASRIEALTVGGQILIGESTFDAVKDIVSVGPPETAMMKGLDQPLVTYPVTGIGGAFNQELPAAPVSENGGLKISLPLRCWAIRGKKVDETSMEGETVTIGRHEMAIRLATDADIDTRNNLKVQFLFCAEAHCFGDIYAKILSAERDATDGRMRLDLHITAIPPQDRKILDKWAAAAA